VYFCCFSLSGATDDTFKEGGGDVGCYGYIVYFCCLSGAIDDTFKEGGYVGCYGYIVYFCCLSGAIDDTTPKDGGDVGCCGYILWFLALVVIILTLPFSLCLCIKVNKTMLI
jgi:hypothetical protein